MSKIDCPFTEEDYKKDNKREEGHMTSKNLREYFIKCRNDGITDCVSGFIIGWTAKEIKEFMMGE